MSKLILAYADLDAIYDYRRCLIQKWITRHMEIPNPASLSDAEYAKRQQERRMAGDALWDMHIAKNYAERRLDTFEFGMFGLNQKIFRELYNNRSVADWNYGWYPSNFTKRVLKVIIDLEGLTDKPIAIQGVKLTVNVWPYQLDAEAKESLKAHLLSRWGGRMDVAIIDADTRQSTPAYYKQFGYVFKYGMLLYEDYKQFFENLENPPIPDTTFLVPDILVKETEHLEGSIGDRLFAQSLAFAIAFKTVPVAHQFYDYADPEA